ncbi:unnamed protein product [Euphydryas editha]|uniref:Uncharacterized protein n=1 Tax=Euphydryas editha TaxID=104508 RepID=A0AAU9UDC4_EUPED|nr:unnamed protein product [Euphydryas editha]
MCCIFTCCGWMVDLIQRLWTFTMSCCISSAVCCSLITASMSGVALGYNYSLAEYMDLKETNVSVYLKRGVFDDEIADDMEWRRSGHQPVAGHIGENKLLTGSDDASTTLRSGRRLDDSIYESNDRNNFEGSLMRLTAKAPDPSPSESGTPEVPLSEVIKQYPGSLDQLKAVQSAINMRKAAAAARRTMDKIQKDTFPGGKNMPQDPRDVNNNRRAMKFDIPPFEDSSTMSSLRQAVPDDTINHPSKWIPPNLIPKDVRYADNSDFNPTYPSPVTPKPGPIRPSRPKPPARTRPTPTTIVLKVPSRSPEPIFPKSIDEEMDSFKDKIIADKFDTSGLSDDEFLKKMKMGAKKSEEDYEDEIKGVPLRRKRSISLVLSSKKSSDQNTIEITTTTRKRIQGDTTSTTLKDLEISSKDILIKMLLSSTIS